ncbi:hypothetical protein BJX62DRAFT_244967 [Aspergillus germanicus]
MDLDQPLAASASGGVGEGLGSASCSQGELELGCDVYLPSLACNTGGSSGCEPISRALSFLPQIKRDDSEISDECHVRTQQERHDPDDRRLAANKDAAGTSRVSRSQALTTTRRIPGLPPASAFPWPRSRPRSLPNDTLHFPTLAAKSLDLQTSEMFNTTLCSVLIPETYAAFCKRLDQDIVAFIRDNQLAQCPPIQWAVRCYATWQLATVHSDSDLRAQSRYIYGVLLRYMRGALEDPRTATCQTTLLLAILLGFYEVFDGGSSGAGSSPDAWLVHVRGAKEILKRRGAAAHFSGFPRTIVFSCRAFFIAEALISGEECFLAEPEWVSISARAFEREDRSGRGCRLVSLIDRMYREVVRVPGMVARARRILEMAKEGLGLTDAEMVLNKELKTQINRCQTALRRLRRGLSTLSPEELEAKDAEGAHIIESRFVAPIVRHNLYAASAVEELLGRLSAMLANTKESDTSCTEPRVVKIRSTPRFESPDILSSLLASSDSTTLDFLFLSLGVMAL